MSVVRLHFRVDVHIPLESSDIVYVTGSSPFLGQWDPSNALPLTPSEENKSRWVGCIETTEEVVKFRYFIGYKLFGECERVIVSQWESHLIPRHALVRAESRDSECRKNHLDIFEYYAGRRSVSEGWLQYDDENQILLSIHGKALKFYKSEKTNCKIKVEPMDVRIEGPKSFTQLGGDTEEAEEDEETNGDTVPTHPNHSSTFVSILSSSSNCKYRSQPEGGVTFNNLRDFLVFKTRSVAVEYLAFFLELFAEDGKRIGTCYALPSSLQDSSGQTTLPFLNRTGRPIAQITLEYLFIRNIRLPISKQLMDTTYAKHWKKRTTLEVGHRGAGNSYTKFAMTRENTIHSLNVAAANGADYVEFDVQLTKDKIAVIYHDFHVLLSVAKRGRDLAGVDVDFHEMAVKDLKLSQLQLLKMDHVAHPVKKEEGVSKLTSEIEEEDDYRPFPTLIEALHKVDPDVGFNIEVKYPMMQENGLHECANYFERNAFVDVILSDVLEHSSCRRILFSSFDPDICAMISMKQNRYPVFFLCVGETQRYARFKDQRCSTSLASVNFAAGADLLGVNFNSEDLLLDPRPVKVANDTGLVSFVWGEDLDKKEHVNYFKKELGVDGIIYDRIGEEERRQNIFVVEREAKRALFLVTSGDSTPQRNCSPEREEKPLSPTSTIPTIPEEDNKSDEVPDPSFPSTSSPLSSPRPMAMQS